MGTSPLSPQLHTLISDFLESEGGSLFEKVEAFGSPTHFIFPQILRENTEKFRGVLGQHGLGETILYFATKVNKAESFLEDASGTGVGADVSSLEELRTALSHGIPGEKISVSGPAKKDRLLALAAQQGCMVSIDSKNELEDFLELIGSMKLQRQRILFRLGGLNQTHTRFGLAASEISSVLAKIPPENSAVEFQGFHFHLSGYSTDERVTALQFAIQELKKARSLGHTCNMINIGGGFAVHYVSLEDWKQFTSSKNADHFLGSKNIQFFYPYGSELSGECQLDAILAARTDAHTQVADLLKEQKIQLAIEPGRSLVDQAGITCIQVKGVRPTSDGTLVVEVDANINHLSEQWFGSEFCVDPIHLQRDSEAESPTIEAAVAGNTCLEIDMLSWRKIGFRSAPKAGDLLVYANTAGYQMDSNESSFHRLAIPEKIAAFKKEGKWKWKKDAEYSFLDSR